MTNPLTIPVKDLTLKIAVDEGITTDATDVHLHSGDSLAFDISFTVPDVFTGGAIITVHRKITIVVV